MIEGRSPRSAGSALPWAAFAVMAIAAAVLFLHVTRGTTLMFDEWSWALYRRGSSLGTFLDSHNGHFSLVPVAIYKLLFATAGLRNYVPYRALVIGAHLGCVLLLFVYAQRRVPGLIALLAAALILFFGPGWQNFLWPFQVAWLISISAGLGAFLLLDRHDRMGDAGACVLLWIALASSGIGLAVLVGLAVDVLGRSNRWRRVWIIAAPLAVYGIWWIAYQNTKLTSPLRAPLFIAKAAASTIAALTGLAGHTVPFGSGTLLTYGPPLAGVGVIALAWCLTRPGRTSLRAVALMATALGFWAFAAIGRAEVAQPYDSRYLYVGAVFVVALAVELARGLDPPPVVRVVAVVLVVLICASNIRLFGDAGDYERFQARITAADLGALDIGRPAVAPGYAAVAFPDFGLVRIAARAYFEAESALGSPAATPTEIEHFSDGYRRVADFELMSIDGVRLARSVARLGRSPPLVDGAAGESVSRRGPCLTLRPGSSQPARAGSGLDITLPRDGVEIIAHPPTTISARRFASSFQTVGDLPASGRAAIRSAPDRSPLPWQLRIVPTDTATACSLR